MNTNSDYVDELERRVARLNALERQRELSRRARRRLFVVASTILALGVPLVGYSLEEVPNQPTAGQAVSAAEMRENFRHVVAGVTTLEQRVGNLEQLITLEQRLAEFERRLANISVFLKPGNNGTASCDVFCAGAEWGPATGTCVGAKVVSGPRAGTMLTCSEVAASTYGLTNVTCLCSTF